MDIPLFPYGDFSEMFFGLQNLERLQTLVMNDDEIIMFPTMLMEQMWEGFVLLNQVQMDGNQHEPMAVLLNRLYPRYNPRGVNGEPVWTKLINNAQGLSYISGETPDSFLQLVEETGNFVRNMRGVNDNNAGHERKITVNDQILMTLIWLRQYPILLYLGYMFNVSESLVHKIIVHVLCMMHQHLVHRYVVWHRAEQWHQFVDSFEDFPTAVAMMDCTPIRINTPQGRLQRLYYRRDRSFHFMNWLVVVDAHGFFTFGQTGYMGHLTDGTCYDYANLPVLPQGLHIMADMGFAASPSILVPLRRGQRVPEDVRREINRRFSRIRILDRIRELKIYRAVGVRRFRNRRHLLPLVANTVMALVNRRRIRIIQMRQDLNME